MAKEITIKIDGKTIRTTEGKNLVQVAKENGIFIPTLCYFENHENPLGVCRVCVCNVNGRTDISCTAKASEGMEVQVNEPELVDARKAVIEMMFAEGNHFCPACEKSGDCDLQHMAYETKMDVTRFPHLFEDRMIDYSPERMILEHSRCIKCMRCVEEIHTDDGKQVFSFCNRGNETVVGIDYEAEAQLSKEQALHAMHICPTGAILIRGTSLSKTFGDRKFDLKSVQQEKEPPKNVNISDSKTRLIQPKAKKIIATVSLAGCFGCHMSMLDIDLGLLDLIEIVEFNKSPLTDIKSFSKHCDLGIVEGGCANSHNVEVLREFRKKCDLLVSTGECAIYGGVPAMRNTISLEECLEEAYLNSMTSVQNEGVIPFHQDIPKILDKVYSCHDVVKIDAYIPGCPPAANLIWQSVKKLLWGEDFSVSYKDFKFD